jgi:hypothetical protein
MRTASYYFVALWGLLFSAPIATAQNPPAWKLAEMWSVNVEWASGADSLPEKPRSGVEMSVVIMGMEPNSYRVDFIVHPHKKPPGGQTLHYTLSVDAKNGWPRGACGMHDKRQLSLEEFGSFRMFTEFPPGYPIEVIPEVPPGQFEGKSGARLTLKDGAEPGQRIAVIRLQDGEEVEIRQTWPAGEKWWQTYERYRNGKLELRARLTSYKPQPARPVMPNPALLDDHENPLWEDPRLRIKVKFKLTNPLVGDFMQQFEAAAGIRSAPMRTSICRSRFSAASIGLTPTSRWPWMRSPRPPE